MSDPTLEALWKNVLDNWENDAAHAQFLHHCQSAQNLAEAAARYAGMRGDRDRGAAAKEARRRSRRSRHPRFLRRHPTACPGCHVGSRSSCSSSSV
jgi:hypothetical protein